MTQNALVVRGLSAWYGQARALENINLDIATGETVGLLGMNGAGKSTLLRCLIGLHRERRGTIEILGHDATKSTPVDIAKLGVSFVREGAAMPLSLTVEEHLDMGRRLARLRGLPAPAVDDIFDQVPLLRPLTGRQAGVLSGGQRQALALASAFASSPRLLLLDEPSGGLSPQTASGVFDLIQQEVDDKGLTVMVVEQNRFWLDRMNTRAQVLEVGAMV